MRNKIKKSLIVFLSSVMVLTASACGNKKQAADTDSGSDSQQTTSQSASSEKDSSIIKDREGNDFEIPDHADKIISMAPAITQTLVDLGLGDKLVAVDKYSLSIKGVDQDLPAYDIMAPDVESISSLKPDIIFTTGMSKSGGEDPFKPITDLGLLMTSIPSASSLDDIKEDILFIGESTKTDEKAEKLVSDMESKIKDIKDKVNNDKPEKTVYFEIGESPNLVSIGNGTYLNEIIEMLGAKNIFSDQEGWVSVSDESVMSENPDIILTNVDYLEDPVSDILNRNGWDALDAVKNKQVFLIDPNASSQPNAHVVTAIEQIAKALYPETFK